MAGRTQYYTATTLDGFIKFGAFVGAATAGAATAGAALAAGGYSLFGIVLALEFVLSTLPLRRRRRGRATLPARLRRAAVLARAR